MNEMSELKDVLDRIEGKLLAASKMYGALNFAMWEGIMILYYLLMAVFRLAPWETALYWLSAFVVAMYPTMLLGKRMGMLAKNAKDRSNDGKKLGILIGTSWGIGAAVGWGLVPALNMGVNANSSFSMGLLSFISISIFGMWLSFTVCRMKATEMLPAFTAPVVAIPIAMMMKSGAMVFGGFVVALGFTLTVIWYIYSAFRVIEG